MFFYYGPSIVGIKWVNFLLLSSTVLLLCCIEGINCFNWKPISLLIPHTNHIFMI